MASIHINGSISNATINIQDGVIVLNGHQLSQQRYNDIKATRVAQTLHENH